MHERFQNVFGHGTKTAYKAQIITVKTCILFIFLGKQRTATQNRFLFNDHFPSYFLLISSQVFVTFSLLCQERRESSRVPHQARTPTNRESESIAVKALQGTNNILGRFCNRLAFPTWKRIHTHTYIHTHTPVTVTNAQV